MTRTLLVPAVVLFALVVSGSAQAQNIDSQAVERAKSFLGTTAEGQFVAGFAHFGVRYLGHSYTKTLTVQDGNGRQVAGHFAIVYDFSCSDQVRTQMAFLCDARGHVYKAQVMSSTGVIQTPFALANASIKILGEALYDALKDNLTDGDKRLLRTLVNDADAQGLMQLGLRIRQANR